MGSGPTHARDYAHGLHKLALLNTSDMLAARSGMPVGRIHHLLGRYGSAVRAEIVAPALGWDAAWIEREVEHYRARVAAERDSQEQLDDRTADSARLGAPEVRAGMAGRTP